MFNQLHHPGALFFLFFKVSLFLIPTTINRQLFSVSLLLKEYQYKKKEYQYRSYYIKYLLFNPLNLYFISICLFSNIFRWICFPQSKPLISHLHISRTDHAGFHYANFIKDYICSSFGNNVSTQTRDLLQLLMRCELAKANWPSQ